MGIALEGPSDEFGLEKLNINTSMNKKRKLNEISNASGLQNDSWGATAAGKSALLQQNQSKDIVGGQKEHNVSLMSRRVTGNAPESGTSKQRSANPLLQPSTEGKALPTSSSANPGAWRRQDVPG